MIKNNEVGFIAVGQAGANIVNEFEKLGYSAFYINTSTEDLATLTEAKHTYHIRGGLGCNKDRNKAKTLLSNNIDDIVSEIQEKIKEKIVFVVFSAGGGTGSGVSPLIIDILQQETDKSSIGAICVIPSQSESVKSHINAYECCKELADIENMGNTFFLDNNKNNNKFLINTIFVGLFHSFLSNNTVSVKGNIDEAEKIELITTKGMSIISKLGKDKAQTNNLISTFHNNIFAPIESDRIIKYIGLINSTMDVNTDDLIKSVGTPIDVFQGYDAPVSICVCAGLSYPFTRLTEIRDKVKNNQDAITKSLQAVNENKLSDDINFLDGLSVKKPTTENKKPSSRDALMKFMSSKKVI